MSRSRSARSQRQLPVSLRSTISAGTQNVFADRNTCPKANRPGGSVKNNWWSTGTLDIKSGLAASAIDKPDDDRQNRSDHRANDGAVNRQAAHQSLDEAA